MRIKDRFADYWNTDLAYSDYKYDLTVFEQIAYGVLGSIGFLIAVILIIALFPVWVVPYLIYKKIKLAKEAE